ncbi:MAG: phosphoglycerate kinase [Coriobacteriia bacterium]|nr:phosphoglycerate kinase [Coriobacteriia bacterium]
MRLVNEANLNGSKVLLRVDFNVPVEDGKVVDDTRIRAVLPTIRYLLDNEARVIIAAHQGRPKGEGYEREYTLAPVALALGEILKMPVPLTHDVLGMQTTADCEALLPGQVLMLENLRFDAREQENDAEFSRELAALADVYVNDAFAASHRAHASIVGVTELLPSYAGFLLYREIETVHRMTTRPERPFVAMLGGSKVSDKIGVVESLLDVVDGMVIGGAMCFTFLVASGYSVGTSLVEPDWVDWAKETMQKALDKNIKIMLPIDIVTASAISEDAETSIYSIDSIPDDQMGLDIGPATAEAYGEYISEARTVLWNGPMGVFEIDKFAMGTRKVATAFAMNQKATTIIGGGDSIAAINKFGYDDLVTFISTGGGALLELLEGKVLPGVAALE